MTKCLQWLHQRKLNNCSGLVNLKDYNKFYICPDCLHDPLPDPTPAISPHPSPPATNYPPPPPTQ